MTTHTFVPDHWHTTLGSHPPVLSVKSGDSVITTTVDAAGRDANGEAVAPAGNPQTGPFFIEGAEPGDTLAVTFTKMYPNRATGWTVPIVAPNVVDPGFVRELPTWQGRGDIVTWDLDLVAGLARPRNAAAGPGALALPIEPMLGCFGVAPAGGEAIRSATSGPHGGNMDYRGFCQGVTVYFPVFVTGALFHLGDGHARQGDGEIVGTGIETSFDVEFRVEVIKGKTIGWPRADNGTEIVTVGNARPLDQALQHATTEMLRWLGEDYGLDIRTASTLLGQVVRYDIGNVFDPAYTVACKVEKRWLLQP
jgi:acetamidase/formamidase